MKLFPSRCRNSLLAHALAITVMSISLAASFSRTAAAEDFDPTAVAMDKALAAALPTDIASRGVLVVGSDTTYPPAEFLGGADGVTPDGIDVDLAKAISRKLGLRLDFATAQFDAILPAIGPKYDLGISAFTITKDRYQAVNFVSYFNAGKQWAVQAGNPVHFNPSDVCGKTVGVQTGSTSEKLVRQMSTDCTSAGKAPVSIVSMAKQTDLITRLINGAIDAAFNGSTNIGYAVKQTNGQLQTIGEITSPSPNGIAVAKSDIKWAELVAKAVNELIADGTYGRILSKWGVQSAAVKQAEVNPSVDE